jgi:uncharacterized protein
MAVTYCFIRRWISPAFPKWFRLKEIRRSPQRPLIIEKPPEPPKIVHKPLWKRKLATVSRWLHLYLSMVSFGIVLFFAVTGLTLNHQDWFSGQQKTIDHSGNLDLKWVKTADPKDVAKLEIVEYLRRNHRITAALAEFNVDDTQCQVSFKGPGYQANAFIDRDTGSYQMTENRMGFVAVVNDLHKARDTGPKWAAMVDIAAIFMICVALTGFLILFFLHKHRAVGLLIFGTGAALFYLFYVIFVP